MPQSQLVSWTLLRTRRKLLGARREPKTNSTRTWHQAGIDSGPHRWEEALSPLRGAPITHVTSTKSLGVHIDQTLSWNVHVENLCKKIASGIGALKRVRSFVPYETLRSIFMSLVQPHFDYCNSVWGCCGKTLVSKLQKLQNRAARILTYSNYDANADNLIKKLGWIKLDSQRSIHKAVVVYKSLNGLTPDYLSSKFVDRSSVSNYSLRDTEGKLAIPQPHTNYMKNSFSYSGAVLWNSLPIELRQADSLSAFRAGCERLFSSG